MTMQECVIILTLHYYKCNNNRPFLPKILSLFAIFTRSRQLLLGRLPNKCAADTNRQQRCPALFAAESQLPALCPARKGRLVNLVLPSLAGPCRFLLSLPWFLCLHRTLRLRRARNRPFPVFFCTSCLFEVNAKRLLCRKSSSHQMAPALCRPVAGARPEQQSPKYNRAG